MNEVTRGEAEAITAGITTLPTCSLAEKNEINPMTAKRPACHAWGILEYLRVLHFGKSL